MTKRFSNTARVAPEQLEFDREALIEKRFTLRKMMNSKLDALAGKLNELSHGDVTWLSRVEDFFHKHDYVTERQTQVVDTILKRHKLIDEQALS